MTRFLTLMVVFSLVGLAGSVGYRDLVKRHPRRYGRTAFLVALTIIVWAFAMPSDIETKGATTGTGIAVVFSYVAMLLGMMAHYGYVQAERRQKRFTFEAMSFFMPVFASPIVFIPLLAIMSDISEGGAFTHGKLMVYLVAFQNGFFWKSFFDQQKRSIERTARIKAA